MSSNTSLPGLDWYMYDFSFDRSAIPAAESSYQKDEHNRQFMHYGWCDVSCGIVGLRDRKSA